MQTEKERIQKQALRIPAYCDYELLPTYSNLATDLKRSKE